MKKRKNKTLFDESLIDNTRGFNHYFNRLKEMSMSVFEWIGLPSSVDIRYLEMGLFEYGAMAFFYDDVLGFLCLPFACAGSLDIYDNPSRIRVYAANGYQNYLEKDNFVIIYNNYLRMNSVNNAIFFAKKLYNIDASIIVNANAQKTPVIVQCDEKERLTMLNLYQQYNGNQPFIFGNKSLDVNALKVLNTDAPYVGDKLFDLKNATWNEAMTVLGVPNLAINKKERLISDEVQRSQGGTIASRYSRLGMRENACAEICEKFDIFVSCKYRDEIGGSTDE